MFEEIPEVYLPGAGFDFLRLPPRVPEDDIELPSYDRYEDADDLAMNPFLRH